MSRYVFDAPEAASIEPPGEPWLIVEGREIPPVRLYKRQTWWQRLLRRPRVEAGWATGAFTASSQTVEVRVEYR